MNIEQGVKAYFESLGVDNEVRDLTPARYRRALDEMTSGYTLAPGEILKKTFTTDIDEMITVSGIQYWSLCEHHMLPFFGEAAIGYIPANGQVVGLSKLPRLVHCYAKRLQMQERMTRQIGEALEAHIDTIGVGVVVTGRHLCMEIRGVKSRAETRTTFLSGAMRDDEKARAEFLEAV